MFELERSQNLQTYHEVLEKAEGLLEAIEPTIYSFPNTTNFVGNVIQKLFPPNVIEEYTSTVRTASAPIGGGGWTGVSVKETSRYAKNSPEVVTHLVVSGWTLSTRPAASDYGSWYEKTLWTYEVHPDLDREILRGIADILDGKTDLEDPRLMK